MIKKGWLILIALSISSLSWADNITILLSSNLEPYIEAVKSFEKNTKHQITKHNFLGDEEKGVEIMDSLNPKKIDLLLLIGIKAVRIAQKMQYADVPVLYTMVLKPQQLNEFKKSTGLIMEIDAQTQFKNIARMLPNIKNLGVFYNPDKSQTIVDSAILAAKTANLDLKPIVVHNQDELKMQLVTLNSKTIDGFWSIADTTVANPIVFKDIIEHSLAKKLPLFSLSESYVRAGALAAFSVNYQDMGKQAAEIADSILSDKNNQPEPVIHPRMVISFINSKTQKSIDIESLSVSNIRIVQ